MQMDTRSRVGPGFLSQVTSLGRSGGESLVGPRPPTLDEMDCYRAWHHWRLNVRPGVTGLWQASARACNDFDDRVRMDLRYIERRSLLGDLRLLSATVPTVLSRRGAM